MAEISHSKRWMPQFAQLSTSHPPSAFSSPTLLPTSWIRIMEKIPLTWLTSIFIIKGSNTMHRWHVSSFLNTYIVSQYNTWLSPGEDSALVRYQGAPHKKFVEELLASASGKDKEGNPLLTLKDLAAYSSKRRVDANDTNSEYTLDFSHKLFGSSKWGTTIF